MISLGNKNRLSQNAHKIQGFGYKISSSLVLQFYEQNNRKKEIVHNPISTKSCFDKLTKLEKILVLV
jgi:hypothetical protein